MDNIGLNISHEKSTVAIDVGDEFSDNFIRGKYKDTTGVSYILYSPGNAEGEGDFTEPAENLRETLKYQYGYSKMGQVKLIT